MSGTGNFTMSGASILILDNGKSQIASSILVKRRFSMKIGKLYKYTGKRFVRIVDGGWPGLSVYLGESIIDREDGVRIVNHKFLLSNGKVGLADKTALSLFSEIEG